MKFKLNFLINILIVTMILISHSICAQHKPIYLYASYKNMPAFERFGIDKSLIIYEHDFYNSEHNRKEEISKTKFEEVVQKIRAAKASIVHVDIESWLGKGHPVPPSIIDRYENTIRALKSEFPNVKFGLYSVVPTWAHWDIAHKPLWKSTWHIENKRRQKIADLVDTINPCLYTYHDNYNDWEAQTKIILEEAKAMGNGKPIIPFLWPKFHQSVKNKDLAVKYLPDDLWKKQMDFIMKNADGVIVWNDGDYSEWDETFSWWAIVKGHLSAR